ncbi:UDP-glucose dehydrogenase family protein [Williamwhitmania taraxaci]|uniref:UDP-glucose 6-dehydrogenase n=1 Tax=Williamwhitmania taraxaci TaxID=1640674 RepID=A0A1G6H669_9BACT|nr:UDP-glucose/GDP-mannose dehydrogenase family protein [Williamwhitmania taraxaci]SDB89643.1 UDPglucose 6-dehydrogenase [Williamwhitmania taraxaci]
MKISVVGSGYVGLVTGTCFAETGVTVTCVDIDQKKIANLKKGIIPIYEPGLDDLVKRNVEKGRLFFTTSLKDSLVDADVLFIAVGTPPDEDGSADLKYVLGVAKEVGMYLDHYMVVVTKSTVPVGTSHKVKKALQDELNKRGIIQQFDVASNPEFLKEGNAIEDFLKPDRIVCGVESEEAKIMLEKLYKPFVLNGHPILFMDIPSSELTKYAANAMLATKISFMNDIASLCELVGADVNWVRKGIGSDSRIGNKFIYPGAGYGGSCFPKDVKAIIRTSDEYGHSLKILKSVEEVNDKQKEVLFHKINKHFNGNLKGKKIAIWGLSFKPNTDDMREAPALVIIKMLLEAGATVRVYDPVAMQESVHRIGNIVEYATDAYDATIDADALLLVTEWSEFRMLNFPMLKKLMRGHVIVDGRNIYEPEEMKSNGFVYYCIGRKPNA